MLDSKVVTKVAKKIPQKTPIPIDPLQAVGAISDILEAYKENQRAKIEIAAINAKKEVLIEDIKQRYDFYKYVFDNVFSERRKHMEKCFEIIDKGIKENNENYVSVGLENLSKVVSSSPIADAIALKNYVESGGKIEL